MILQLHWLCLAIVQGRQSPAQAISHQIPYFGHALRMAWLSPQWGHAQLKASYTWNQELAAGSSSAETALTNFSITESFSLNCLCSSSCLFFHSSNSSFNLLTSSVWMPFIWNVSPWELWCWLSFPKQQELTIKVKQEVLQLGFQHTNQSPCNTSCSCPTRQYKPFSF